MEPENDFLLIQALELTQHRRSKLGKASAFNPPEQYLNFPMLPLLFSIVFFLVLTLSYLVQTGFPSVYLLVFLNTVTSGRAEMSKRQKSRQNNGKWSFV